MDLEAQHVESLSSTHNKLQVKDFIWSENEWPTVAHDDFDSGEDIPIISLSNRSRNDDECYKKLCKDMVTACERWGFVRVVDHGVAPETVENMKRRCLEMFDLPMEVKMKGTRSTCMPLGYSASNLDYGHNLPWAEIIQLLQSPQHVVGFAKKVYGDKYQLFSDAITDYMNAMDGLGMVILETLAHGLGLPHDFFTKNFNKEKESTMIRVNRYPPCPLPERCLGLGSHSDPHTLTILLQDDVGGLQVQKGEGVWVGVRPIPNSFIINIGDTFEAWSNGRLKSVVHRAVVNREKKRLSVAYFMSPASETIIDCPLELVGNGYRKYKPFTWSDFRSQLLLQRRVVGKTALFPYLLP
ncbi:Gibberellin 20 oxidase 1 [Acorus gramineus]|uniref:Gibberellin 20 oxidase 1 n=1 Tax=Acorus gramineus TaxID=55184 RepID=A0AAV9AD81_ACOGR|nr:Gibberellin 20 oxidase 1 [Acorus gramineus]